MCQHYAVLLALLYSYSQGCSRIDDRRGECCGLVKGEGTSILKLLTSQHIEIRENVFSDTPFT